MGSFKLNVTVVYYEGNFIFSNAVVVDVKKNKIVIILICLGDTHSYGKFIFYVTLVTVLDKVDVKSVEYFSNLAEVLNLQSIAEVAVIVSVGDVRVSKHVLLGNTVGDVYRNYYVALGILHCKELRILLNAEGCRINEVAVLINFIITNNGIKIELIMSEIGQCYYSKYFVLANLILHVVLVTNELYTCGKSAGEKNKLVKSVVIYSFVNKAYAAKVNLYLCDFPIVILGGFCKYIVRCIHTVSQAELDLRFIISNSRICKIAYKRCLKCRVKSDKLDLLLAASISKDSILKSYLIDGKLKGLDIPIEGLSCGGNGVAILVKELIVTVQSDYGDGNLVVTCIRAILTGISNRDALIAVRLKSYGLLGAVIDEAAVYEVKLKYKLIYVNRLRSDFPLKLALIGVDYVSFFINKRVVAVKSGDGYSYRIVACIRALITGNYNGDALIAVRLKSYGLLGAVINETAVYEVKLKYKLIYVNGLRSDFPLKLTLVIIGLDYISFFINKRVVAVKSGELHLCIERTYIGCGCAFNKVDLHSLGSCALKHDVDKRAVIFEAVLIKLKSYIRGLNLLGRDAPGEAYDVHINRSACVIKKRIVRRIAKGYVNYYFVSADVGLLVLSINNG